MMQALMLILSVTSVVLVFIFRGNRVFRIFSVVVLLAVGVVCYFGVITSSRLAIIQERELIGERPSQEWIDGAVSARKIAQQWLPLSKVIFLGSLILALFPAVFCAQPAVRYNGTEDSAEKKPPEDDMKSGADTRIE